MDIQLFGAAGLVTGSCTGVTTKKSKVLVDCGMFQGSKDTERMNYANFGFNPREFQALILTHAHLDHCGRIPKLWKEGFRGKIYASPATKDLAYIIMSDAANIAFYDTKNENKRRKKEGLPPRTPIYTQDDVDGVIKLFKAVDYGKQFKPVSNMFATFLNSGHILGACSVSLEVLEDKQQKLVNFSGDLGQDSPLLVQEKNMKNVADFVFLESTYGDRLHTEVSQRKEHLKQIILDAYKRKGVLLIPSFAIERTQELVFEINYLVEHNLIPKMKVYLDSPMGIKATEVFKKYPGLFSDELRKTLESGDDPFTFPGLVYTPTVADSKKINDVKESCIIIAGSGMCNAGRIKHHIKNRIDNPKNTILFVGYQAEGTLGYWIKKGEKRVRLLGTEVEVNAKVESMDDYSGHADYNALLGWLKSFSPAPSKVFLVHGEKKSLDSMYEKVNALGIEPYIPKLGEVLKL